MLKKPLRRSPRKQFPVQNVGSRTSTLPHGGIFMPKNLLKERLATVEIPLPRWGGGWVGTLGLRCFIARS